MFRRQFINTIRRYSHQHCEKNIPQINSNQYFENNEPKLDLIQKRICKDIDNVRNDIDDVQDSINILFTFNIFTTVILLIKSV
jgi:hypothetical protein